MKTKRKTFQSDDGALITASLVLRRKELFSVESRNQQPEIPAMQRQQEISRNTKLVARSKSQKSSWNRDERDFFFVLFNFCLATMLRKRRSKMRNAGREFNLLKRSKKHRKRKTSCGNVIDAQLFLFSSVYTEYCFTCGRNLDVASWPGGHQKSQDVLQDCSCLDACQ